MSREPSGSCEETLRRYRILHNIDSFSALDWPGMIEQADASRAAILRSQQFAVGIAGQFINSPTSPELLGWFMLWSRAFLMLQAAADLKGKLSEPIANYLQRVLMELALHVRLIKQPYDNRQHQAQSGSEVTPEERAWETVADRLRGYCAWLLLNDLSVLERNSSIPRLQKLFTATPREEVWPQHIEHALEPLFGPQELVGENEASRDLAAATSFTQLRKERVRTWLSDCRFGHWTATELRSALEVSALCKNQPSLGEMLDAASKASIFEVTKAMLGEHLYTLYAVGSQILHGSTIEYSVMVTSDSGLISRDSLLMSQPENPSPAERLSDLARVILLEIALLGERVVPRT